MTVVADGIELSPAIGNHYPYPPLAEELTV